MIPSITLHRDPFDTKVWKAKLKFMKDYMECLELQRQRLKQKDFSQKKISPLGTLSSSRDQRRRIGAPPPKNGLKINFDVRGDL
jgi:hypothetical protein